jgi:hypothetical protein
MEIGDMPPEVIEHVYDSSQLAKKELRTGLMMACMSMAIGSHALGRGSHRHHVTQISIYGKKRNPRLEV